MVPTSKHCKRAHNTVESSHRCVVTLYTLLNVGGIKVPIDAPLFERPEYRMRQMDFHVNEIITHFLSHPVEEGAGDTHLVVGVHDRSMVGVVGVCSLCVFQGFIQYSRTLCTCLNVKADHVTGCVFTVENQREAVVCKGVSVH